MKLGILLRYFVERTYIVFERKVPRTIFGPEGDEET
jgi:hypothetical protein